MTVESDWWEDELKAHITGGIKKTAVDASHKYAEADHTPGQISGRIKGWDWQRRSEKGPGTQSELMLSPR